MYFKKLLGKIFNKKQEFKIKTEHQIEKVFECEGIEYFKFTNELNIPAERAFSALDIYNELDCKVDREYLLLHCDAVQNAINEGRLDVVANLHKALKDRLQHITEVDIMYKLASVLYFDANENPYKWDLNYAKEKIKIWQKSKDVESFFLQTPLKEYLPSFTTSQMNLEIYTKIQRKEKEAILEYISNHLSNPNIDKELKERLETQIATLQNLINQTD